MSRQRKTSQFTTLVRVLAFLCLLGSASSAQAAAAHVQSGWGTVDGAATSVVTGTGTGADALETTVSGNALFCAIRWNTQAVTLDTVSDGTNNLTVSASITHGSGSVEMAFAYAYNITGTATEITATFSAGTFNSGIMCDEASGIATSNALDGAIVSDNAEAGTAVDCPAITPSENGEYLFAATTIINNNDTTAPNTGSNAWVEGGEVAGDNSDLQTQYFVQSTAASITPEWTQSSTDDSICMAAAFKSADGGGGGSGVISSRMLLGVGK